MNKTIEKYRMLSDTLDTVATLDKDENIETVLAFNQLLKRTTEEQLRLINVTKEIMSNKSSKRAEEELQLRNTTNKIISNKSLVKSR